MFEKAGTKGLIGVFAGVMGYIYSALNELVIVLIIFIIMDYILGMLASFKGKRQFDKEIAIWGLIKKVLYGFVFITALLADYIIIYLSTSIGIDLSIPSVVGIAALAYLLGTEGHSISRHLIVLGVPAPDFLLKFFGLIKDTSGKIVPIKEVAEKEGEE